MQRPVDRCVQGPVSGLFQHRAVGKRLEILSGLRSASSVQRVPQPASRCRADLRAGLEEDEVQVWAMVLSMALKNIDVVCLVASVSAIPLAFAPTVASMALSWMFPTRTFPSLTDSLLIGNARLFCTNPVTPEEPPVLCSLTTVTVCPLTKDSQSANSSRLASVADNPAICTCLGR